MINSIFKLLSLLFLQIVSSCDDKTIENKTIENKTIITIDVEDNYNNMLQIDISQFCRNIVYIPLKKVEGLEFNDIIKSNFSDSLILISDYHSCLLYNSNGQFISKIGNQGRGPGEYQSLYNIGFGNNKRIYIQSYLDLFEFNMDGSFSEVFKKILSYEEEFISSWISINDSLFFGKVNNGTGKIRDKAVIFNKKGEIISHFRNFNFIEREKPAGSLYEWHANIYNLGKDIFFKEIYIDTMFCLNESYDFFPKYVFKFGKFKEFPIGNDNNSSKTTIRLDNVFQTANYLFLDCQYYANLFPAKRLTPRTITRANLSHTTWYNTTNMLGIYNKLTGKLVFCEPTSTDNPLFTSGLYNDIDCGPRFFPKAMVNDSTMVMWITAKALKDHVESDDFKNTIPKYPDKKKELEKLVNNLSEFDNPVLMFITFKK